jgi:hypothetical protein
MIESETEGRRTAEGGKGKRQQQKTETPAYEDKDSRKRRTRQGMKMRMGGHVTGAAGNEARATYIKPKI